MRARTYLITLPVAAACTAALLQLGAPERASPTSAGPSVDPLELPLVFEANGGRTDERVRYMARGSGYRLFFTDDGTVLRARGRHDRDAVVRTRLVGGSATAELGGEGKLSGKVNSLLGNDPAKWRRGIDAFQKVRYRSVYRGIDLVYHGTGGRLEYDFVVQPGARPTTPRLRIDGARLRLSRGGDLLLDSAAGRLRQLRPVAYQDIDGRHRRVSARFELSGREVGFRVGRYDRRHPLVIDPVLKYATFIGGTGGDVGTGVAVDSAGNAWVSGYTYSGDFPITPGAYDTTHTASLSEHDIFVTKITPDGDSFAYSTYIGGGGADGPAGIDVDSSGTVYLAGGTQSSNFPMVNAADDSYGGSGDMFALRLNATGDALIFSTFIGGAGVDGAAGQDLNSGGLYLAGQAGPGITAVGAGAVQTANQGSQDGFFAKVDLTGTVLYATYLGSNEYDFAWDVDAEDSGNSAMIVGETRCGDAATACTTNFPTTANAYQAAKAGATDKTDAFVTVIDPAAGSAASALRYSTFLGGAQDEVALAVDYVGGTGIVGGRTGSNDFPLASPTLDNTAGGGTDGFAARVWAETPPSAAASLDWSTYLGGTNDDRVDAVTQTSNGVYFAGQTKSGGSFPSKNTVQAQHADGDLDAFVAKMTWDNFADSATLIFSTTLGGEGGSGDSAADVVADDTGQVWFAGKVDSSSSGFPVTPGAAQTTKGSVIYPTAFAAKLALSPVVFSSGPAGPTSDVTPTFAFTSGDTGNFYYCRMDGTGSPPGNGFTTCTSPFTPVSGLADGAHHLDVYTTDQSGTTDGSLARREFVVDTTAPSTPVLVSPAAGGELTQASWTYTWQASTDASTSVESYDVVVGGKTTTVDASTCSGGTCSFTPADALGDGSHSWSVSARDILGNTSPSATASFTVAVPPTAMLSVAPNPALIGTSINFDASGSSDPGGAIARHEWDLDGDGVFELDTGGQKSTSRTYPTAGDHQVSVRVTDGAGLTATASVPLRINITPGATAQFGASINRGAQYTNKPDVKLSLVGPLSTTSILVSNDGGFASPMSFLPASEVPWTLDSSGPERLPKTVYVRFLPQLTQGLTFTDDIILDEIPPKVLSASVRGGAASSGASASARKKFKIRVRAADSNSGVARVQVTANKRKPGKLLKYKTRLTVTAAKRPLYVRARDRALNFSRWRKLR